MNAAETRLEITRRCHLLFKSLNEIHAIAEQTIAGNMPEVKADRIFLNVISPLTKEALKEVQTIRTLTMDLSAKLAIKTKPDIWQLDLLASIEEQLRKTQTVISNQLLPLLTAGKGNQP